MTTTSRAAPKTTRRRAAPKKAAPKRVAAKAEKAGAEAATLSAPAATAAPAAVPAPAAQVTGSNAALLARRANAVPRGVASAMPFFAERALNAELWDVEGRRFIDFAGGIAVLNTGHCHPKVMDAALEQAQRFTHTSFQVVPYEAYVTLAERLNALAPGVSTKKTLLVTTGAEAVENAVKIARAATGRSAVIAFDGGYHGRTMFTLGLTGKVAPYKTGFGPFPGEIYRAPLPSNRSGLDTDACLAALETLFLTDVAPSQVAAIILEPVLGEGGYIPVPAEMWEGLREICDRHGILLIADEIQSGFGRTGTWFAIEHARVEPDLITVAKSMAGGFPVAGVIGRAEVMDAVAPGGLGGTYGGNPMACAAALAAIDALDAEALLPRSTALGELFRARFAEIGARTAPWRMWDIRGLGAMIAVELVTDFETAAPDAELTKALVDEAQQRGLILLACGMHGNAIRVMVPLTASDEIIEEGLAIFEAALAAAVARVDGARAQAA
ncbi:4-aminobutyrate--2-oxoglutarate transaminase [Paralimibaculum aggregatum]|uniref:4-aminobutyrate--2-oxoglutarate transaminase n=1 Tax=Paralimibaculum aggregatum TaxID=3036245 RepID=A0ABQ6LJV4_9RHOB|nr:4-aminobutyrate--2-oxoglutarate transaminase [Limibaculum sp. NKW23]GMG83538.1 4-aminobutyrate--2-oxoglutarate transaminase [Limibaculum sp. NKW23]